MNLFRFFLGYVTITFTGAELPRLIRLCTSHGIFVWNIRSLAWNQMSVNVYAADVWKLHDLLHKTNSHIADLRKTGVPFLCHRYRHKAVYFLGIAMMFLLLSLLSEFVWTIHVSGNSYLSDEVISDYLSQQNAGIGSAKKQIDTDQLEKDFLKQFPEIIWISIYLKGTSINISMKEQMQNEMPAERAQTLCTDLVAPCDGVVESIFVRHGTAAVQVGDEVKKDTPLIYGWVPITDDSGQNILQYTEGQADGDVVICGTYPLEIKEAVQYEKKIYTGQCREYITIGSNWSDFCPIPYLFGKTTHTTMTSVQQCFFANTIPLPFYWNHVKEQCYSLQKASYTKQEMENNLQRSYARFEKKITQKGIQIIDKNVIISYGNIWCTMKGDITFRYPACEYAPSDIPMITSIREQI